MKSFHICSVFTKMVLCLVGIICILFFISSLPIIEEFNVYDIMSGEASLYPGYECKFGGTFNGCNKWTGCQDWKGSLIHPENGLDMTSIVSVKCLNPNLANNLHRNWTSEWLSDRTKHIGGFDCESQTDGFKCKSGLCLSSNGSSKCAKTD